MIWVQTQTEKEVVYIDNIEREADTIYTRNKHNNYIELGYYKTQRRTIEVFKEMIQHIVNQNGSSVPYVMPKE